MPAFLHQLATLVEDDDLGALRAAVHADEVAVRHDPWCPRDAAWFLVRLREPWCVAVP